MYSQATLLSIDNWEFCALLCKQITFNVSFQTQIFTGRDGEGEKGEIVTDLWSWYRIVKQGNVYSIADLLK